MKKVRIGAKDGEFEQIDGVKVPNEQSINKESPARSIAKAISWRILASSTTFTVLYFSFGKEKAIEGIITIVGIEAVAKMVIYYFHERAWANILWGRSWLKYKLIRRIKLNYIRFIRRNNP